VHACVSSLCKYQNLGGFVLGGLFAGSVAFIESTSIFLSMMV
jgi:hypothetical protein